MLADLPRLRAHLIDAPTTAAGASLSLIGRRHVRSNNSWMHQSHRLIKGKARDQLMMHPTDLATRGLVDGQMVEIVSRTGSVKVAVQATERMMPGVVSLPHGFGHNRPGTRLGLAHIHPGASYNDVSDEKQIDAISGNGALNGVPVEVRAA
jgi:anaerobic selenocysteine-containing dehydrogenase